MDTPGTDSSIASVIDSFSHDTGSHYTRGKLASHAEATTGLSPSAALVLDPRAPGGLELTLYEALRAAGLQQQRVAVLFVPLDATPVHGFDASASSRPQVVGARLVIDTLAHEALLDGQVVALTAKEFALLCYLFERRGLVNSREALLRDVWGDRYAGGTRTVDVHVRRLRRKLGSDTVDTVRGSGYKFGRRAHAQLRR